MEKANNEVNHKSPKKYQRDKTANFGTQRPKFYQNSISVVKEEDESKEVSKKEERKTNKMNEEFLLTNSIVNNSNNSMVKKGTFKLEEKYTFLDSLGEGSYGKVLKVVTKDGKNTRA